MQEAAENAMTTPTTVVAETVPGTTIRFFLSSTFADFQIERDILQKRVFPELRQMCASAGFRLQPIDMRWGVSEAAGTNRQTLRICFDELARCRQLSPDFYLLILLGQRYGSCLLPPQIPADLAARLLVHCSPDEQGGFAATYRLDENAVPPKFVLLQQEGPELAEDEWLRQALVRAGNSAGASDDELLLFAGSATHREIQLGLLGESTERQAERGVLSAVRTIVGDLHGSAANVFVEPDGIGRDRLHRLRAAVLDRVPLDQTLQYTVDWRDDGGPTYEEDALTAAFLALLRPKLENVIASRVAAQAAASAKGYDTVALANAAFERERAAQVEGRDMELARLSAYLLGDSGAGTPLLVTGAAGSGKSTLLAEAVRRATAAIPDAVRVVRYCGVTPGSESISALLTDVRQSVAQALGHSAPPVISDENQLISAVAAQLSTQAASPNRPVLIVIDALDQLGAHTQRTDWLPSSLAPHVRVVVSVLADRPEVAYLRARLPSEQILALAPLSAEAGAAMLRDLLAVAPSRTLTPSQQEAVVAAFAVQGAPLHLRLLAAEARTWHSFDPPQVGVAALPVSTPELLDALLARLEAPERNGQALVASALGNLAVARVGLAEDELLDLLGRDEAVRVAQRELSPYSPPIDPHLPLPASLWARLYAQVEPLLTERQADAGVLLLTFYHAQLRIAAETRYLVGEARKERHHALASYFDGQPWRLGPQQWNWRKVREVVSQWEGAGDRASADLALNGLADTMEPSPDMQAHDVVGAIAVMSSLRDHIDTGGYWVVGRRLYAQELAAVRAAGNRVVEGEILGNMGLLADHLGHPDEAAQEYAQALTLLREVGNRVSEGSTLNNLGTLAIARGQLQEAGSYFEASLVIRRQVGDRAGEGNTLSNLGQLVSLLGRRDEARSYLLEALAIEREVGDRADEAVTLNNLGQLAFQVGDAEEAAQYFTQGLALLREVGDHPGEAVALNNLGSLAGRLGQWQDAAAYFQQALTILREVHDRASEGATLTNIGSLASRTGHAEEAERSFQQALSILREVGDRQGESGALNSLGALARAHNRFEEAEGYYAQALAIVRDVGDRASEGLLLNNMGSLVRAQGRPEEARAYFEQALAIERAVDDRVGEGHTLNNLGALVREQNQLQEATSYFDQALAIRREVGDREGEAGTLINLGALARAQGRPEKAARSYEQALAICDEIGAIDLGAIARGNMDYLVQQQQRRRLRWWPFRRGGPDRGRR
jgi:tetratricopeptide (TPR) repeat protein